MKKQRLYFVILAVIVNTVFSGCDDLAELAHGPKPEPLPAAYTVTYSTNGGNGTTPAAQTAISGSSITLPSGNGLSRTGYTFGGWNTDASGTGTNYSADSSYTITGNVTLYARWIAAGTANYTITFNINEGSGTAPAAQTAISGSSITLPSGSGFSRSGYTFSGWNTNPSGTGNNYGAGSPYTVTGNVTLYAQWADASTVWTVKFETNGGSPVGDAVVLRNTAVSRPSPDPVKTGHEFDGWYTNAGLTTPYNFSSIVTDNITLYAKWNPITYTVTFNINSGSGTAPSAQTANYGSAITLPSGSGLSRTGYTFGGWNTNTSGTGTNYSAGSSYTVTGSVILYAKWNPISYTVTFNINSGSGTTPSAQTADFGSSITLPSGSGLSRNGYIFGGWNTNTSGTGTNYNAGSSYTITGNVTLYAKWDVVPNVNVPGTTLAAKLSWLQTNAQSNVDYTVEVTANESISPATLSYNGRTNISITLKGTGAVRTVSLSPSGSMFTVSSGVTLVLDNNITLQGRSDNNTGLVRVNAGGTLIMNAGSRITGNTGNSGGGVQVGSEGTFIMNGGTISDNIASSSGGGVYVDGTFTMNGGTISNNTASSFYGGGVATSTISPFIFTMNGGTISGNTARFGGGGVNISGGVFTKTGGTIYGYSAGDTVNSNVVKDDSGTVQSNIGHAVYVSQSNVYAERKRRETTAGPSVNLSWDGTTDPPTFSGGWEN